MSKQVGVIWIALAMAIAGFIGWSLRAHFRPPEHVVTIDSGASATPEPQFEHPLAQKAAIHAPLPSLRPDGRGLLLANAEESSKQIAAAQQRLRSRFSNEPVNAVWAAKTEKALEAAKTDPQIDQLGAKPLAFAARCRSSVCLMTADFPSADAANDWFTLYTMQSGDQIASSTVHHSVNPDGTFHLEIYGLARGK